jgi:hypothetical protein
LAAAESEAVKGSGGGECLDLRRRDPGTAYQVGHVQVGTVLVAFFHDGAGDVVADDLDAGIATT